MLGPSLGQTARGQKLLIDIDRLITTRALLTANAGAGKSWAIRRVLEQTHGRVLQFVLDPEGEFFTMREKYPYVLIGKGGDCPADPRSAALLARRLLELKASAIIDLFELLPRDRIRFVKNFLEALIDAPKDLWQPVLVIVDEAHTFAPEHGHGEAESTDAMAALMSRGRKRGFTGILATQRLSKLNKDIAAEANNKLIGRLALDVDVRRAARELGLSEKDAWAQLPKLKPGTFFVTGPALCDGVEIVTVGEVKTHHPIAGASPQALAAAPPSKVRAVLAQLADLPKEAEEEARSIETLQAKVRSLETEIRNRPTQLQQVEAIKEVAVLSDEDREAMRLFSSCRDGVLDQVRELFDQYGPRFESILTKAATAVNRIPAASTPSGTAPHPQNHEPRTAPRAPSVRRESGQRVGVGGVSTAPPAPTGAVPKGGQRRILIALANRSEGLSDRQIGLRAHLSSKSGTFSTYLSRARTEGWISDHPGSVRKITPAGLAALGSYDRLPTGKALLALWLSELSGGVRRMLQVLADVYPATMDTATLGARAGISPESGTFSTYMSKLRGLELITGSRTDLAASKELFE